MKFGLFICCIAAFLVMYSLPSYCQTIFSDNWESGDEWSEQFKGVGEAKKGGVNEHTFCGHFNQMNEKRLSGVRSGLFRAISHSSLAGPPNEAWAWRRVNGTMAGTVYKLKFFAIPEATCPANKIFYAFGYNLNLVGAYNGSSGVLGNGLPFGLVYPNGQGSWKLNGSPTTATMTSTLANNSSSWFEYETDFTALGSELRLWGIVQNIESAETHAGFYTDDITVTFVGYQQNTPTPTQPPQPTSTPQPQGCESYRGDADCNGSITPGDALKAFNFFLGTETPAMSPCDQRCAADADRSGSITPGDALCIFNKFLGTGDCI